LPPQFEREEYRFCLIGPKSKSPFEQKWQAEANYSWNDDRLKLHLANGGNYGVIGGFGGLIIIDFDDKKFEEKIRPSLPPTFTVRTGSGGTHLYYQTDEPFNLKILDADKNTLADIQGKGRQCVGPGSTHPNGNQYVVENDLGIKFLSAENLRIIFHDYLKEKDQFKPKYQDDALVRRLKQEINLAAVLQGYGYDLSKNPTMCQLGHTSKEGKCFSYKEDLWYCFHCDKGGDIFNLVMEHDHCNFAAAKKKLMAMAGIKPVPVPRGEGQTLTIDELRTNILHIACDEKMAAGTKEANISELVVDYIKANNKIHTTRHDELPECWIYSEGIYLPQGNTFIKEFCREIFGKRYNTRKIATIIQKIQVDTYIDEKIFFAEMDINKVPLLNGILNLRTLELEPFSDKYCFFNKLPIMYDKTKDCPYVLKFLDEILLSKSDIGVIQEIFGYLLFRSNELEKAIMFTGKGRNGKSKTIELMKRFIGIQNCVNIPLQTLEKEKFSRGELLHKLANLSADISKTGLTETGYFKMLTGRDLITGDRKFLPSVHFQNYAKLIFSANELPETRDITDAFFHRWVIIDFPFRFVSAKEYALASEMDRVNWKLGDPNIIDKISTEAEISGLLNWALIGLHRIWETGDFSYSLSNDQVKATWMRKSSSIMAFIMDCVERKMDSIVTKEEFLEAYFGYCSKYRVQSVDERSIKNALEITLGAIQARPHIDGERTICWRGIILKDTTPKYMKQTIF